MKWKWGYLFKVMYEALLCVCAASFGYITHEMMNFQDRSFPFLFFKSHSVRENVDYEFHYICILSSWVCSYLIFVAAWKRNFLSVKGDLLRFLKIYGYSRGCSY